MRRWVWIAGSLGLILLLFFGGPPAYRFFRLQRSLDLARKSFAERRFDAAGFFALQAWKLDENSDEAIGILSKVSRRLSSPQAVLWTGRWAEMDPKDPSRQLDFAQTLLGAKQITAADKVLAIASKSPEVDKIRLAELYGALAISRRNLSEAEKIFRQAVLDYPDHPTFALNLANLLVSLPVPEKRAEGKKLLLELWEKKEMQMEVSRSLVQVELFEKAGNPAAPWAQFLGTSPDATLDDHLSSGDAILQSQPELSESWLKRAQELCKRPEEVYVVSTWLRLRGKARQALEFLAARTDQRSMPMLLAAKAEAMSDLDQWKEIESELIKENWEELDAFRFAYLQEGYLREYPGDRRSPVRLSLWRSMIGELLGHPGDYFKLSQLIDSWKWPKSEKEELLAELTDSKVLSDEMLFALVQAAERAGDTLATLYLAKQILRRRPTDLAARNNTAMFQMLLRNEEAEAFASAAQLFKEYPANTAVRTTQAFALYLQGKNEEALALMNEVPAAELSEPSKALYYALILKALGKNEDAMPFFEKAKAGSGLLPEERLLLFQHS